MKYAYIIFFFLITLHSSGVLYAQGDTIINHSNSLFSFALNDYVRHPHWKLAYVNERGEFFLENKSSGDIVELSLLRRVSESLGKRPGKVVKSLPNMTKFKTIGWEFSSRNTDGTIIMKNTITGQWAPQAEVEAYVKSRYINTQDLLHAEGFTESLGQSQNGRSIWKNPKTGKYRSRQEARDFVIDEFNKKNYIKWKFEQHESGKFTFADLRTSTEISIIDIFSEVAGRQPSSSSTIKGWELTANLDSNRSISVNISSGKITIGVPTVSAGQCESNLQDFYASNARDGSPNDY